MFRNNRIFFVLLSLIVFLSSCKTFDGYYYSLDDARNEIYAYSGYNYIFTEYLGETIVDFLINDNTLYIVEISVKGNKSNPKFKISSTTSFSVEEAVKQFILDNNYHWESTSNLVRHPLSWCIVTESFNRSNNNYSSYVFMYKDESYCLCYNL